MRISRRTFTFLALAVVAAGALGWYVSRRSATGPFTIPQASLSGWTLVVSDGTDPWIVGAQPPASVTGALFQEVSRRARTRLLAPPHSALPLVLRTEFEEGLQGVYGTDSVLRIAKEAGIETATFQPVCLAHRTVSGAAGRAEVYFVPFESEAFTHVRVDLLPTEPEHAGIGSYEPSTLSPMLIVAATDDAFERWWPLPFDRVTDCIAELAVGPGQN